MPKGGRGREIPSILSSLFGWFWIRRIIFGLLLRTVQRILSCTYSLPVQYQRQADSYQDVACHAFDDAFKNFHKLFIVAAGQSESSMESCHSVEPLHLPQRPLPPALPSLRLRTWKIRPKGAWACKTPTTRGMM